MFGKEIKISEVDVQVLLKNVNTTGQLVKALSQLPSDTVIHPFGSEKCKLIYSPKDGQAYLDEDFSGYLWLNTEDLDI